MKMAAFRKKPVVIEATQWLKDGDHPSVQLALKSNATGAIVGTSAPLEIPTHAVYAIPTLEGWHEVTPGDWIITGVKGEHYPCKDDIFKMTYEPA